MVIFVLLIKHFKLMYSTKKKPKQENCVKILSHVFIKSFCEAFANGTSTLESDSMFFDTLVYKAGLNCLKSTTTYLPLIHAE